MVIVLQIFDVEGLVALISEVVQRHFEQLSLGFAVHRGRDEQQEARESVSFQHHCFGYRCARNTSVRAGASDDNEKSDEAREVLTLLRNADSRVRKTLYNNMANLFNLLIPLSCLLYSANSSCGPRVMQGRRGMGTNFA